MRISGANLIKMLLRSARLAAVYTVRILTPFCKPKGWLNSVLYAPYALKESELTCAVFHKHKFDLFVLIRPLLVIR